MAQRPGFKIDESSPAPFGDQKKAVTSLLSSKQKPAQTNGNLGRMSNANTSMISMSQQPTLAISRTDHKQPPNKFVQSFQANNVSNTLVIKNAGHVGGGLTANGFSAVQSIQTFEKDSFPRRNITNKLRNAHNTKANKMVSRGGSINESNQIVILPMSQSPKTNVVTLPNLAQQQSGSQ